MNQEMNTFFGTTDNGEDPFSSHGNSTSSSFSRNIDESSPLPPPPPPPPLSEQHSSHLPHKSRRVPLTTGILPNQYVAQSSETENNSPRLTHADETGKAAMVDVGGKKETTRSATATVRVLLGRTAFSLVAANQVAKGDVLTVAQLAGIMGAKHTATLIPLCHPLLLSHVEVLLELNTSHQSIDIKATAATTGPTGVEMEAMTAAAVSALTVYDMCKAASKKIEITDLKLVRKSGGKSGEWVRR
jgi:cyclic pyranopterin phosphate synthase